jgi:S-methylmethionine-dependent homocysteine/selenocysteine methylase
MVFAKQPEKGDIMARYREALPQLGNDLFLTDGGMETTLIFHEGVELPEFASFTLLKDAGGEAVIRKYFQPYLDIARRFKTGLILDSATWRANPDWGAKLGYSRAALSDVNRQAIRLLEVLRDEYETEATRIVINGCIGPRGDGYIADSIMSESEAEAYHREQIETFADTAADMVCALTINYAEEAVGIARAAKQIGMPVVISFTVETDGRLPNGKTLPDAIEQVERASSSYPLYYMINCAHPTHFEGALTAGTGVIGRIRGVRANASRQSHAELNEATVLDDGSPDELGQQYADLKKRYQHLNVLGGCCGTDHRHIEHIAAACAPLFP